MEEKPKKAFISMNKSIIFIFLLLVVSACEKNQLNPEPIDDVPVNITINLPICGSILIIFTLHVYHIQHTPVVNQLGGRNQFRTHNKVIELLEQLSLKRLAHVVANHLLGGAMYHGHIPFFNLIRQKEITNVKCTGSLTRASFTIIF